MNIITRTRHKYGTTEPPFDTGCPVGYVFGVNLIVETGSCVP